MVQAVAHTLWRILSAARLTPTGICPDRLFTTHLMESRCLSRSAILQSLPLKRVLLPKQRLLLTTRTDHVFHFRPPCCWMNDPNGTIFHNGWYHVFYQFNPYGDASGFLHWGHTRSRDLVQWEHLPPGIWPSYELGEEHCWSGCAAINGRGEPMIFYTSVGPKGTRPFEQWAAVGDSDLLTWRKHPANPILALGTGNIPHFEPDWRDPFIFSVQNRRFMVIGAADVSHANVALFEAEDTDLVNWRFRGNIYSQPRRELRFCECPNFFPLDDKFLLLLSPYSNVEYMVGTFDPDAPAFLPEKRGVLDSGVGHLDHRGNFSVQATEANYYATNVLVDDLGQSILLGWVRGFRADQGWSGCLALPRLLTLGPDGLPRQRPLPALQQLRDRLLVEASVQLDSEQQVLPLQGDVLELEVTLAPHSDARAGMLMRAAADGSRGIAIEYDGRTLRVNDTLLTVRPAPAVDLQIFLDRSVLEVFVNNGEQAITQVVYSVQEDQHVWLFADNGSAVISDLQVWSLAPVDSAGNTVW